MAEHISGADALGESVPMAPALYQASVYALPDLDALDRIIAAEAPGFIYARDAHPNARRLADQLAVVEGAAWGMVCGSGMAAISAVLLTVLQKGGRVVASDRLYGRTTQLLQQQLPRFGVQTALVDTCDLDAVRSALQVPTQLLFVETMSNPLLRLCDLGHLAEIAKQHGCLLAVDNTFATPELVRPIDLGADLVVESLTKLIAGHSDVTLGLVCGRAEHRVKTWDTITIWGLASNPFDCWLAERGLCTLSLRMRSASANAAILADWLTAQPGVTGVCYPGRTEHPDHELAKKMLRYGYGNMLCFELAGGRDGVNRFLRLAPGIPLSPSLGHTTTTCSHPASTSHRHATPSERARQGIGDGLIRLSVGIEDVQDIEREISRGLDGISRQ